MLGVKLNINFIKNHLSLDAHVSLTLLFRFWNIVAGSIMLVGLPFWFTKIEQGYYFIFASVLGLQVFFELGLNFVVTQFAAHESANLKINRNKLITGNVNSIDRIRSLAKFCVKLYAFMSFGFFALIGVGGIYFYRVYSIGNEFGWTAIWLATVFFCAINLLYSPMLSIFEGLGMVGKVAQLRLLQSILGYLTLWIFLINGYGLNAYASISCAAFAISTVWLYCHRATLYQLLKTRKRLSNKISWRSEILPFQWRIAISWISGYLIFQIFNPFVFAHQGALEAGKIGLALTIFSTTVTLSMSWISSKAPYFSFLIASGNRVKLKNEFFTILKTSFLFNVIICGLIVFFGYLLKKLDYSIGDRLPDLNNMIGLMIVCMCNHIIFSLATFMRCHKVEPMLYQSVIVGILTLGAVYYGSKESINLMVWLYAAITIFVALPWTLTLFKSFYKFENV